jgi:hypothetical protein
VAVRAGVSDAVFSEVFPSAEECYRATYEEGLARLARAVELAVPRERSWFERVRAGVVALLGFLDDEPGWGRLLVLDASVDGAVAPHCQQRLQGFLTCLLDDPAAGAFAKSLSRPGLTAELVAGGVFCVIRARARDGDGEPFVELAPSLISFIAVQYGRPDLEDEPGQPNTRARAQAISRAAGLPIRATHRTTIVLRAIAQAPYSNNREVAQAARLADEGQTSKLLARLERQGVIENVGIGAARGEPNAWVLTTEGRRVLALLDESFADRARRRATGRMRGAL